MDVIRRSQTARICEFGTEPRIRTPCVIGDRGHVSLENRTLRVFDEEMDMGMKLKAHFPDVVSDADMKMDLSSGDAIHVIANGFDLRNDFRGMLRRITSVREKAGHNALIYMAGAAEPSNLALLVYLGVDMVDDTLARAYGMSGIRCIPEGTVETGMDEEGNNISEMERECEKVIQFIKAGRLRELVDQRAASNPFNVALLRTLDRDYTEYQERSFPTVGQKFACNTTQSLNRPDVKRFRKNIMEMYKKPAHKKVLVLLPCSAKKPYHTSKTHRAFSSAIHTGDHDVFVHEVIVTSPLGAVPRELDVFYPANSYDIPVTGEWKCQEREFIREAVKGIIDQGYDKIISHLGDDTDLVRDLADMTETCVGDATSPASLRNLEDEVRKAAKQYGSGSYATDRIENVRSILTFQFNEDIASRIMDGSHAIGKFPYWKIFKGKTQLGMLTPERQMVSLTMEGAEILADAGFNTVQAQPFELKGNMFAVGVESADERIREGDEAVVIMDGKVKAVGVAMMSGREMVDMKRGIAVKVRHKSK